MPALDEHDIVVRLETPGDIDAVRVVNEQAFGRPEEADLVTRLRENGKRTLSLVAVVDGLVVGHILFSDMLGAEQRLVGLAPMSVLPDYQRQGVGERLIAEAIGYLREQGYNGIVVLGHPKYYARFGFRPAATFGISTQFEVPEAYLMALDVAGTGIKQCLARYQPEFDTLPA